MAGDPAVLTLARDLVNLERIQQERVLAYSSFQILESYEYYVSTLSGQSDQVIMTLRIRIARERRQVGREPSDL